MSYTDKNLTCRDCGASFVFTAGEQDFHAQKGFTNTPMRCPKCRAARKAGGNSGGGRRDSGPRQMYSANCSACGKECQVPFQPSGEKPVYCSDCFQGQRGDGNRSSSSRTRRDNDSREMYSATCSDCGRECQVPFEPTGERPVYCADCYQEQRGSSNRGGGSRRERW